MTLRSNSIVNKIIEVQNLVKKYGDFEAVKGISFEVSEGEIFGLLGPNGAGTFNLTSAGSSDIFIVKLAPSGSPVRVIP